MSAQMADWNESADVLLIEMMQLKLKTPFSVITQTKSCCFPLFVRPQIKTYTFCRIFLPRYMLVRSIVWDFVPPLTLCADNLEIKPKLTSVITVLQC